MTQPSKPTRRQNRRFLVSIWHLDPGSEAEAAAEEPELHGLVWQADPHEPGRIVAPASFGKLDALPRIFGRFLFSNGGGDGARDGGQDEPGGRDGSAR